MGVWEDPAAWGIMLADLAGHIANAYEQDSGFERARTLKRLATAFNTELSAAS
jgi:hypothetical protein